MQNANNDWEGIVLHLYRQVDGSVFSDAWKKDATVKERTFTAYGNFDRLCFAPISRFVDYLKESSSAYRWIGGRKDIMLYPLPLPCSVERHFIFGSPDNNHRQPPLEMQIDGKKIEPRFILVSMLYFSDKVKAKLKTYDSLLNHASEQIRKIVDAYNIKQPRYRQVTFDLFGTFNSAELCILWGAEQFVDVQYLVDQIRFINFTLEQQSIAEPVFTASYTIVANGKSNDTYQDSTLRGCAMIQLTSGTVRKAQIVPSHKDSVQYLRGLISEGVEACIDSCAGEYDFVLKTRPPQLSLFSGRRGLHSRNDNFRAHFANSTTRLVYEERDIDNPLTEEELKRLLTRQIPLEDYAISISGEWEQGRIRIDSNVNEGPYAEYRKRVIESIGCSSSYLTNLDLMYGDYIRAVNMSPDRQWAKDLECQFNAAMDCLCQLREPENPDGLVMNRWYIDKAEKVFEVLRQQIHHITEAGKFIFEEPSLQAESTSEFDLLFHMYYGVVKDILGCIYERSGKNIRATQSTLIPLIRFRPTPIVKSELYFDLEAIQTRLVDITIPYDALGEPNLFLLSLIHELYHYVAPCNRGERNELFAKIAVTELLVNEAQAYLEDAYKWCIDNSEILKMDAFYEASARVSSQLRTVLCDIVCKNNITQELIHRRRIQNAGMEENAAIDWENMRWQVFEKELADWCESEDGFDDVPGNFGGFLTRIMASVCEVLDRMYGTEFSSVSNRDEDAWYDKKVYQLLRKVFSNDESSDTEETVLSDDSMLPTLMDYQRQIFSDWINVLLLNLREILPDYSMARMAQLSVTDYLLVFAILQEKLHNSASILKDTLLPIRMGCIIDQLLPGQDDTQEKRVKRFCNLKQEFVQMYCAYAKHCGWEHSGTDSEKLQQDAGEWFVRFTHVLSDYYNQYGCYRQVFHSLVQEQFEPLCTSQMSNRIEKQSRYFSKALKENGASEIFAQNLADVKAFQHQPFLKELSVQSDEAIDETESTVTASVWNEDDLLPSTTLYIDGAQSLLSMIQSATKLLERDHRKVFGANLPRHGLWYRGSQNSTFDILPSIMVHYLDDENLREGRNQGNNTDGPLWLYQRRLLERFKYQADGAGEFINPTNYTVPDYLVIMQHYQKFTTYLDWSEDAFSSLFFALEQYVEKESVSYPKANASLYILDPMLYNRARKKLVKNTIVGKIKKLWTDNDTVWRSKQNEALDDEVDGYIPNMSERANAVQYGMFSMDLPVGFRFGLATCKQAHVSHNKKTQAITLDDCPEELINLPIAIHTCRLNPRVRNQSGQFIAYSPFVLPAYGKDDVDEVVDGQPSIPRARRFSYISLLKIQDYYLRKFPGECPFMYDVQILPSAKEEVAEYLRKAGINRYRIYPELTNLKL
ncbi:MAG: FRG domain-containing protein [Oscillospiraceae bacterium]|nr:FRG domain-containing protein [Oscillospiraceae bacterium]